MEDKEFEYTDTPQQTHLVELDFITIALRAKAIISNANIIGESWFLLCKDTFQATTKLDNLTIIDIDGELKQDTNTLVKIFLH